MLYDVVIIGGGPAGLSAALNVAARGKTCAVLTNDVRRSPLYRARVVDNYAGMRGQSGAQLLDKMQSEAEASGAEFFPGRVISLLPFEDQFMAALGSQMVEGRRAVLATGALGGGMLPGEEAFVGQGVSYCATCDGMLYRGRSAVVTGNAADLAGEANFLREIGVLVTVVTRGGAEGLAPGIEEVKAGSLAILGQDKLEGVAADEQRIPCDVVFILREVMAPDSLVPGLALDGRFVRVNRRQETNIPGLYAAGDCTGKPLQIAKAVGEGLIAAQEACRQENRKGEIYNGGTAF